MCDEWMDKLSAVHSTTVQSSYAGLVNSSIIKIIDACRENMWYNLRPATDNKLRALSLANARMKR